MSRPLLTSLAITNQAVYYEHKLAIINQTGYYERELALLTELAIINQVSYYWEMWLLWI